MPGAPGQRLSRGTSPPAWALPSRGATGTLETETDPGGIPVALLPIFTLDPASYLTASTNNNYPHVPPSQRT